MNFEKVAKLLRELADELEESSDAEQKELKRPIQLHHIKSAREIVERSGYRLK